MLLKQVASTLWISVTFSNKLKYVYKKIYLFDFIGCDNIFVQFYWIHKGPWIEFHSGVEQLIRANAFNWICMSVFWFDFLQTWCAMKTGNAIQMSTKINRQSDPFAILWLKLHIIAFTSDGSSVVGGVVLWHMNMCKFVLLLYVRISNGSLMLETL